MLEFVNDPQFDGLPLVGEGHVLVARRTECGRAARWVPGGDVVALAEFLGPSYPVVGDRLFEERSDGSLFPVDLSSPFWVHVPPAGEPVMKQAGYLTSLYAQVVSVGRPGGEVKRVADAGPGVPSPVISGPGVAKASDELMVEIKEMAAHMPASLKAEPAKVEPVKRAPGRPKKETPGV